MRILFYIKYTTEPGQSLFVTGNIPELGNNNEQAGFALTWLDHQFWYGCIEVNTNEVARIQYSYIFKNKEQELLHEGGQQRTADLTKTGMEELQLMDSWNPSGAYENIFYTDPFQKVLLKDQGTGIKIKSPKSFTHLFRVKAPLLKKHEVIVLSGAATALKEWNTTDPCIMSLETDWWAIKIKLPKEALPLIYKYGIYNVKEKSFVAFEEGDNRLLHGDAHNKKLTIVHDGFVRMANNTWKGAGVSIPVFSLKSNRSFGVGEFTDLKLLADWAQKTGIKMIQLLPVNDTTSTNTFKDSYPYAAISTFALHPLYINLDATAGRRHPLVKSLRKKQQQLNELPDLDYEQVIQFKLSALKELFAKEKDTFLADKNFKKFFEESRQWLIPYAAFCYLRDRNGTADFLQWKLYSDYDQSSIEKYVSPKAKHYTDIAFTYYLQYHLHLQLKDAVEYAHEKNVIIKGDIPIGVNRRSCDAWINPELFNMNVQSGAPPDDFAVKGQNWGFPTYNWERMAGDNFQWWRKRFEQMGRYFDAFRIDHILGFFRIWNIPIHSVQGIMGTFFPALPIHVYEFGQRGMWFNFHRFCKPYITDAVLWELFGPNKEKFLPFLEQDGNNHYILKESFSTQRQVERYFNTIQTHKDNNHLRDGLYELISNVVLFEQEGSNGQEFHFRISLEHTTSFRHLDWNIQQQLKSMYQDYFFRRQDEFWRKEAMKKLPSLKRSTNMMICGEDLGMVPRGVPEVMNLLGILSLEIQRMPKDELRQFFHPADASYLSVVTPSTHDMSPIRSWWEENKEITQKFYNYELGQWGEAPATCDAWINKAIVIQHLYSPAMWSVFQLQDLMGMGENIRRTDYQQERINIPAISDYYWRYRMHITLEQLIKENEFNEELKKYIGASGR